MSSARTAEKAVSTKSSTISIIKRFALKLLTSSPADEETEEKQAPALPAEEKPISLSGFAVQILKPIADILTIDPTQCLGSGGVATVYKATFNGKPVAVKQLKYCNDPKRNLKRQQLFRAEAQKMEAMQALSVSCMPHYYTYREKLDDPAGPVLQIVMDQVAGEELFAFFDKCYNNPELTWMLPVRETIRILMMIVESVCELAEKHIAHLDLSSENIIWDGKRAVMVDFSNAALLTSQTSLVIDDLPMKDNSKAPEYRTELKVSLATDVYAMGTILFSGSGNFNPPLYGKRYAPFFNNHLPQQFCQLVKHCWQDSDDKRPTMQAVRDELRAIAKTL